VGVPKNLVVCCDGTANEFARDHTNVLKLFSALAQEPGGQLAIYHPGVGTMEAVGRPHQHGAAGHEAPRQGDPATDWRRTSGTPTPP
jgi:hypothetical protein